MPEVRARVPRVSVAEYHKRVEAGTLGKRAELIRGLILKTMPKSPLHSYMALRLFELVKVASGEHYHFRLEQPLTLTDSEPEPDIAVVRGRDQDFVTAHPRGAALVVEVAFPSAELDRENAALYAENGIEEYWIVMPKLLSIEIFRQPSRGVFQETLTLTRGVLQCGSVPEICLGLDEIFKGCPV